MSCGSQIIAVLPGDWMWQPKNNSRLQIHLMVVARSDAESQLQVITELDSQCTIWIICQSEFASTTANSLSISVFGLLLSRLWKDHVSKTKIKNWTNLCTFTHQKVQCFQWHRKGFQVTGQRIVLQEGWSWFERIIIFHRAFPHFFSPVVTSYQTGFNF